MIVLIVIIGIAAMYATIPNWTEVVTKKIDNALGNQVEEDLSSAQTQAKFVNLDGRVQVKKVNSVTWVDADYHTTLDKGDLIQTGSDGAARVTFADGTEYTINKETLITVEENTVTKRPFEHWPCVSTPARWTWRHRHGLCVIRKRQSAWKTRPRYMKQNSRADGEKRSEQERARNRGSKRRSRSEARQRDYRADTVGEGELPERGSNTKIQCACTSGPGCSFEFGANYFRKSEDARRAL